MTEAERSSPESVRAAQRDLQMRIAVVFGILGLLLLAWWFVPEDEPRTVQAPAAQSEVTRSASGFGAVIATATSTHSSAAASSSASSLPRALLDEISTAPDAAQSVLSGLRSTAPGDTPAGHVASSFAERRGEPRPAADSAAIAAPPAEPEALEIRTSRTEAPIFVQVGVFDHARNAQALMRQLKDAGVPAQLQTRVQIGPFKSHEDLLRAQEKLRRLGLDSGAPAQAAHR